MARLRIVSVNDVYALTNLPRLKSLVQHHRRRVSEGKEADAIVVVLAGDFLSPSLLSSIDAGRGMVECLNDVGVEYVVLGNHEDDLPVAELRARLTELHAVCLGTNVLPGAVDLGLPRSITLEIAPGFEVGLVGVVTPDEALYRGKPFGGASVVDANPAATTEAALLVRSGKKGMIAITHQSLAEDRALGLLQRNPPFAAIIGGHEHVPFLVEVEGTWIVKTGAEAVQAGITDIVWNDTGTEFRTTTRLEDVSAYPEDEDLAKRITALMAPVVELSSATLLYLPPGQVLSSIGTRSRQTSMGSLLCSRLRDALEAETCLLNGGGIRGSRDYRDRITYGDIEVEVPFDNEIVVVDMPGIVVREAIQVSRSRAPVESGSFLQVDDRTIVDPSTNEVAAVNGLPIDLERTYKVALVRQLLLGLDHVEPLTRWAHAHPELVPPATTGREPKMVLVQAFAVAIWRELGGFESLDSDHDGKVTPAEVAAAVARVHPSQAPAVVLADLILRAVDASGDRVVTLAEEPSRVGSD